MPGLSYPEHWPTHPAKDQFADWLDAYRRLIELDVWTGTECLGAAYDEAGQHWRVTVERADLLFASLPLRLLLQ